MHSLIPTPYGNHQYVLYINMLSLQNLSNMFLELTLYFIIKKK